MFFFLQLPFIDCKLDSKPIRDLLLEYKAEVVEEELEDEEEVIYLVLGFGKTQSPSYLLSETC